MDRKGFIINIARGSILIGLAVLTKITLFKDSGIDKCNYQFICNSCKKLSDCKLPEAVDYKGINKLK